MSISSIVNIKKINNHSPLGLEEKQKSEGKMFVSGGRGSCRMSVNE